MADGPSLVWIRHQLDALAWQRVHGTFGRADQVWYEELCEMEREWLATIRRVAGPLVADKVRV